MHKHLASNATHMFALSLFFFAVAAQADSVPTITITSASVDAYFGGDCQGDCVSIATPIAGFTGFNDIVGAFAFQATPGYDFESQPGGYNQFTIVDNYQNGYLIVGGTRYPTVYYANITGPDFIVPSSGMVELPAVLTGGGQACSAYLPAGDSDCSPYPGIPNPVVTGGVLIDIPGDITFTFSEIPEISNVVFSAVFTPVPEPSTASFLLAACTALATWRCGRNRLCRFR